MFFVLYVLPILQHLITFLFIVAGVRCAFVSLKQLIVGRNLVELYCNNCTIGADRIELEFESKNPIC